MTDKKNRLTREEEAELEMSRTTIAPACRILLIVVFLLGILAVPVVQLADDIIQNLRGQRADAVPDALRMAPIGEAAAAAFQKADGSFFTRISEANRAVINGIDRYETQLEDKSWLAHLVLPNAQAFFTKCLGLGNEKGYVGVDGDLYYRPDINYVTGPGFLEPSQMHQRRLASTDRRVPVEPNPLPAIVEFNRELDAMGIRLILLPVPVKPSMQAAGLYRGYPEDGELPDNPSYEPFLEQLRANDVDYFDCRELLLSAPNGAYLKQDTHWLPESGAQVAEALAKTITSWNQLPAREPIDYIRRKTGVLNLGDIVALLRLNSSANIFPMERVELQQVLTPDKQQWARDSEADVLLLGDSFTNIFSIPSLNWGRSAGFAEQLSFYLKRPLDRISFNDNGSYATRRELARRHGTKNSPLAGKKVVIWEFAVRELAQGDWPIIPLTGN